MDKTAEKWLTSYAYKNLWRVTGLSYDLDDLIQDGQMCAAKIKQRYPKVTEPRHFMALLQITFCNHVTNLAKARSRYRNMRDILAVDAALPDAEVCSDAALLTLCAEAPEQIGRAIRGLVQADGKQLRARYRVRSNGTRETVNERLCRLAGIELQPGLLTSLHEYLSPIV